MTELEKFIQEHGQPVETEGPDANGVTTYHAANGNYIAIGPDGSPRMRGARPPAEGSPAVQAAIGAPPAAPGPPPGSGKMNQQQLEALLAQIAPGGDPNRFEFNQGTRNRTSRQPGGLGEPERSVSAPVQTVQWIDRGTGLTLEADVEPDGSYTVTYNGTKPANQGKPAASASAGGTGPKEGDTRGGTASNPKREVYENGAWVVRPNPLYQPPKPPAPDKPGPITLKPDGKGGSVAVRAMPDGTVQTTALPNVPSEATRVTVDGIVYEKGPDGQFAPAKGIPLPGATSKNIEPFTPDPAAGPDLGLGAWAAAQRAKIGQPSEAGGITQTEYDAATKAAHDQATVYIQNVTSNQTVRRQQEQDERTQRNDLSNQAAADYARASGAYNQGLRYMDPNLNLSSYIPAIMAEQAKYRAQREGMARAPVALHPMFQNMPAAAGVTTASTPPAAPAAPAPPNALGLGALPGGTAPGVVPSPVREPQPIPPTVPATPTLPPPSDAQAAANAGPVPGQDGSVWQPPAAPALMKPALQGEVGRPGDPGYGQPATYPSQYGGGGDTTDVNPPAATPGYMMPPAVGSGGNVMMAPGPVSAWANQIVQPQQPAPMPTGQPGLMAALPQQMQAAPPVFDPMPTAGKLAQWGIDADIIAQVLQEMGGA